VQGVEVDAIVTFLDAAYVAHSGQVVDFLVVKADDAATMKLEKAAVFVDNDTVNLTAVQEDQTQEHHDNSDHVLPPMPFTIAFENRTMVSKCQMVDQIDTAAENERTGRPERAWIPAEDNLVLVLRSHIDVLFDRDEDARAHIVLGAVVLND